MALFRVLQESLTNVHRHSASRKVDVHIGLDNGKATHVVRDYGRGLDPDQLEQFQKGSDLGVGLGGMRERIREVGGIPLVRCENPGASVRVTVPVIQKEADTTPSIGQSGKHVSAA